MSEIFLSFERDFVDHLSSIRKMTSDLGTLSQTDKARTIEEALKEINDAEKCVRTRQLRQMEIETFMMNPTTRIQLSAQVRDYRDDIDNEKRLCKKEERDQIEIRRQETLMGARLYGHDESGGFITAQLIGEQNIRLSLGQQTGHEAEGDALDSLQSLAQQRDSIKAGSQSVTVT